jgi:M6 family metalloprotease-like protein
MVLSPPFFKLNKNLTTTIPMRRITKICMLLSMAVTLCASSAYAIPADTRPKKVVQPDGTVLTVVMSGDEHRHLSFTEDGFPLFYNSRTKTFEYARLSGNSVAGSGITASDAAKRSAKAKAYLNGINTQNFVNTLNSHANAMRKAAAPRKILINDFPSLGKQKSLVILIEFSDLGFTSIDNPKQFYTDMLNKEGFTWDNGASGSVRDFYLKSSFGLFDPTFTVVGPVKLSHGATYYGSDTGGQDNKMGEAVTEACKLADSEVNFADYDTDGDGYVDNIYFFYAGYGQADDPNGTDFIWPHSAHLETDWKMNLTLDDKKINRYACSNEIRYSTTGEVKPTGIGTFVHEFGHVLGLADHYDVSYGMLTFGLGSWDTMASGAYNNSMNTPPLFSAFERSELSWLKYTELNTSADSVNVLPNLGDCNKGYVVKVPNNKNEYYVLENRQQTGFDKYLPGHGMLVWHIDMDSTAWMTNTVNVTANHQRVDLIEADGIPTDATRSGDAFPGASNVTQYQLSAWDGTDLVKFADVNEKKDTIKMLLENTQFKMPSPKEIKITDIKDSSFVMTWSPVDDARYYLVSIYTKDANGNKTYVGNYNKLQYPAVDTLKMDGLTPKTDYEIEVQAGIADYTSDATTTQAQTEDLIFEKRKPAGLNATDITSSAFTANWDALRDADNYRITLYKHDYSTSLEAKGYDFTDKFDGMPELWSTSSTTYYSVKGYYGQAAPSLRLSATDDYLIVAYPESKIHSISFWCKSNKASEKIHVEKADGDDWKEVSSFTVSTAGETKTFDTDDCTKVRLRYEHTAGYVVIDDVTAQCYCIKRTPVTSYTDVSAGNNLKFAFKNLAANSMYSFRIKGESGDKTSYTSDECVVTLPVDNGISITSDSNNGTEQVFDLQGRRVNSDNMPQGIYIIKKGGKTFKTIKK